MLPTFRHDHSGNAQYTFYSAGKINVGKPAQLKGNMRTFGLNAAG
jgi:hypothetical protein